MLSRNLHAPWWLQTSLAVLSGTLAATVTILLRLEDSFLVPILAVVLMALRGGFAAGVISGISTLVVGNYFLIRSQGSLNLPSMHDAYGLGVFIVVAGLISMVAGQRREAQLTLEATLASIGDGVIVTDNEGRVRFINAVAETLTGWTNDTAAGQPIDRVFNVINEDSRTPVAAPILRSLREGIVVGLASHTMLVARDGTERPIADSGAPIRDHYGRIIGAVLVFSDASTQRDAEDALKKQSMERQDLLERERDARAEAERANRLKDEFLATLSHELRTPLNAVLGWAHMLTRRQLTTSQQKQAITAIHRNAQAQARLVDDVLDLSRIVTGRMSLTAETVDLSEVVRATAESFTPAVLGKAQDLRLEVGPNVEITGDPHRLRQVIWNLLSNATKFTPEGGVISCSVAKIGVRVELTVSDSGQGIEPGFLPYVFDRFRQGDSSTTRGHGGLGLGLALVRHLVEAHGGTVYATSAGTGRGTTVVVRLPARADNPRDVPLAQPSEVRPARHPEPVPGDVRAFVNPAQGGHANAL